MLADPRRTLLTSLNLPVHRVRHSFAYIDWHQGFGPNELRSDGPKRTQCKVAVEEAKIGPETVVRILRSCFRGQGRTAIEIAVLPVRASTKNPPLAKAVAGPTSGTTNLYDFSRVLRRTSTCARAVLRSSVSKPSVNRSYTEERSL